MVNDTLLCLTFSCQNSSREVVHCTRLYDDEYRAGITLICTYTIYIHCIPRNILFPENKRDSFELVIVFLYLYFGDIIVNKLSKVHYYCKFAIPKRVRLYLTMNIQELDGQYWWKCLWGCQFVSCIWIQMPRGNRWSTKNISAQQSWILSD